MAQMKKPTARKPAVKRPSFKPVPLGTPPAKPEGRRPVPSRPTPKPTVKATVKPMTASEKAFIKNQKEKAKATKRTGVYPNTAN
jgi:hypothetical protein